MPLRANEGPLAEWPVASLSGHSVGTLALQGACRRRSGARLRAAGRRRPGTSRVAWRPPVRRVTSHRTAGASAAAVRNAGHGNTTEYARRVRGRNSQISDVANTLSRRAGRGRTPRNARYAGTSRRRSPISAWVATSSCGSCCSSCTFFPDSSSGCSSARRSAARRAATHTSERDRLPSWCADPRLRAAGPDWRMRPHRSRRVTALTSNT